MSLLVGCLCLSSCLSHWLSLSLFLSLSLAVSVSLPVSLTGCLCLSSCLSLAVSVSLPVCHWLSLSLCIGPHGLAFTRRGCFSTKLAHSFLSHLCLSFCLPESFTCTSFHPSTSPDISAVFELGLSFLSTPAFHLYFSFIQAFFLPLLFFSVVH